MEQAKSLSLLPKGEGVAKKTCDEQTATPMSSPPAPLGGEEVEKLEVKPEKKEGVRGRCCKIWFYFSSLYSDLIGNK